MNKLEKQIIQHEEIKSINSSSTKERLYEQTQVQEAKVGRPEIYKNRGTHTDAVVNSAIAMTIYMAEKMGLEDIHDIDYRYSLIQSCLLHDFGHPPFGHDGQKVIHRMSLEQGIDEGFDDNNNNIVIIERNNIKVRPEVIADIIKYPHKLYQNQKEIYLPVLNSIIEQDKMHFAKLGINLKDQKRTIACQIMDEADRNTYTCDDMNDYFRMKIVEGQDKFKIHDFLGFIDKEDENQLRMLSNMLKAVNSGSKTKVREFFNSMKDRFNENWNIGENGVEYENKSVYKFRESLSKMTFDLYIKPIRAQKEHYENIEKLKMFSELVFSGEYKGSKYYNRLFEQAQSEEELKVLQRDCIGNTTDHYVINTVSNRMEKTFDRLAEHGRKFTKK